jgi:hypothetical protein
MKARRTQSALLLFTRPFVGRGRHCLFALLSIRASVIALSSWGTTVFLELEGIAPSNHRCLLLQRSGFRCRSKSDGLLAVVLRALDTALIIPT